MKRREFISLLLGGATASAVARRGVRRGKRIASDRPSLAPGPSEGPRRKSRDAQFPARRVAESLGLHRRETISALSANLENTSQIGSVKSLFELVERQV